jgi:hypothetical protein
VSWTESDVENAIGSNGAEILLTNDGHHAILREIDVAHPGGKEYELN